MKYFRLYIIVIGVIVALSAILGGIGLIYTNGLGMPVQFLDSSIFNNYVIPGLILSIIVGGTHVSSIVYQIKKLQYAPIISAISGFGLIIWTFTELYTINMPHSLQAVFFGFGIATLSLSMLQLSKIDRWNKSEF